MKNISIPADLARESVIIGSEAAALAEKVAADQSVIDTKAPLVAQAMIDNGVVDEMHKQATIDLLRDPAATLDIVARLSKLASAPRSMGSAAASAEKSAEYNPQFPPQKESDRVFEETLGAMTP